MQRLTSIRPANLDMSLIKAVVVSKTAASVGEGIRVQVETPSDCEVTINGVPGSVQYLQFAWAGPFTVRVAANRGTLGEQARFQLNIANADPHVMPFPIIWARGDPECASRVTFELSNVTHDIHKFTHYIWDFGDGSYGTSITGSITHEYSSLRHSTTVTGAFDVSVEAWTADGATVTSTRTQAILNIYNFNKVNKGILTPHVAVHDTTFNGGVVLCSFTITNVEDEALALNDERTRWLTTSDDVPEVPREAASNILVPANGETTVERAFQRADFRGEVFGVALAFRGFALNTKRLVIVTAYLEVKIPAQWTSLVDTNIVGGGLARLTIVGDANLVARNALYKSMRPAGAEWPLPRPSSNRLTPATPPIIRAISSGPRPTVVDSRVRRQANGGERELANAALLNGIQSSVSATAANSALTRGVRLLSPRKTADDFRPGTECDPDNPPDNIPEGSVCQFSGEYEFRNVPARILNAKKGDILMDSDRSGMVGQLLRVC